MLYDQTKPNYKSNQTNDRIAVTLFILIKTRTGTGRYRQRVLVRGNLGQRVLPRQGGRAFLRAQLWGVGGKRRYKEAGWWGDCVFLSGHIV